MKKLTLTLLSLLALTLTGCEKPTQEQIDARAASCISEFNYKGHHYIKYSAGAGNSYAVGIAHDPNCSCYKKGEEK